jgi:hypothetical protein
MRVVLVYAVAWLGLMLLAILNGSVRQFGYARRLGDLRAHQLSTLIGLAVFSAYLWMLARVQPIGTPAQAVGIGALWLAMTLLFEFGFGHYVAGHPWSWLLADFNILRGRLWILILAWCALAPWVSHRLQ